MERKVIKFNLVGAICVCLLIIAIVVGIVIAVIKINKKGDSVNQEGDNRQASEKYNYSNIDVKKEYAEKVKIQDEDKEVILKTCRGTFGYAMMYDKDHFYVEKNKNGKDMFNSLQSDTIGIYVFRNNGDYDEIVQRLKNGVDGKNGDGSVEYGVGETVINGAKAVFQTRRSSEGIRKIYYVKADDGYFVVQADCGAQFEESVWPVMEMMIFSFEEI